MAYFALHVTLLEKYQEKLKKFQEKRGLLAKVFGCCHPFLKEKLSCEESSADEEQGWLMPLQPWQLLQSSFHLEILD